MNKQTSLAVASQIAKEKLNITSLFQTSLRQTSLFQKDKDFKALKVRAHIDSVGCLLHIKDRLFIQGGHRKGQAVYRC
jgi:hypothetical protein